MSNWEQKTVIFHFVIFEYYIIVLYVYFSFSPWWSLGSFAQYSKIYCKTSSLMWVVIFFCSDYIHRTKKWGGHKLRSSTSTKVVTNCLLVKFVENWILCKLTGQERHIGKEWRVWRNFQVFFAESKYILMCYECIPDKTS